MVVTGRVTPGKFIHIYAVSFKSLPCQINQLTLLLDRLLKCLLNTILAFLDEA